MEGLWNPKDVANGCFIGVRRVVFEHYRVPYYEHPGKIRGFDAPSGKPHPELMHHYRKGLDTWTPSANGGKTLCILTMEDGKRFTGEAVCSLSDTFDYKFGRDIAFERALLAANVTFIPF
jgi:hypothetical protein